MQTQAGHGRGPLVELSGAGVVRAGAALLRPIDFRLEPGARWAVLGTNGAGKTTFLRLLRGDIPPDRGGGRTYDLPGPDGSGGPQSTALGLRHRLAQVSGDMQDAFVANGWAASGLDVVLSGFGDGPLVYGPPDPAQAQAAAALLESLGLGGLAGRRMATLSSGEGRRLLLARALVAGPDALLLDECLEGLDAPARREFLDLLDRVAGADPDLAVLFATHRLDELPGCLTHALALEGGRVRACGPLAEVLPTLAEAVEHVRALEVGPAPVAAATPPEGREFLARLADVSVDMDGAAILRHVDWTIRPGEHWAVLGPNGAGKSTLLAVLAGRIWPSAVDGAPGVVEYGFAGLGATVDESRRRIGFVSAGLQAGFPYDLRVGQAVATGLDGSLDAFAAPDAAGLARVERWVRFFELEALLARRVRSLSRGQFRRVLLARALAGDPALLVLDEPMAGLDRKTRAAARELFDALAGAGVPLVLVTHHEADLPGRFVSGPGGRVLALRGGRVAFCGGAGDYARWKAARKPGRPSPNG